MDVDDFFDKGLDDDDVSDEDTVTQTKKVKKKKSKKKKVTSKQPGLNESDTSSHKESEQPHESDSPVEKKKTSSQKHKDTIDKLQTEDPEFYEFLKNEDKELLDFDVSDDGDDFSSEDEKVHTLPSKLEVDSDMESSEEEDDATHKLQKSDDPSHHASKQAVNSKMINDWTQQLQRGSLKSVREVILAFKSAVISIDDDEKEKNSQSFSIEGGKMFNEIVRLCITEMVPAVSKYLSLKPWDGSSKINLPSSCGNWEKIKPNMKSYVTHMVKLLARMTEPTVVNALLKHVHMLIQYVAVFPDISKLLLKRLTSIWSSGEETSRVLAFLSISRITRVMQKTMLEFVLKQMYTSYVKNCKFSSPTLLPMINFMQRCLVEMFAIDFNITYQYAFIYIRQLAIHLRNAITVKKEETRSAVYNWQFIHSLHLWTRLLSLKYHEILQPLVYPLTQTIIGTIQLVPIARYYPLRFHCIRHLNTLASSTNTFIPTLPFLLEIFEQTDFNKRPKSLSFKPYNFNCILKLTKAQLGERAFRDGLMEQMFEFLMDTLNIYSSSISFPEVCLPVVIRLKDFVKKCKIPNYTKQMKSILDKVQETSKLIVQKRKSAAFTSLTDTSGIDAWESKIRGEGTPLSKFYRTYRAARDREIQMDISQKEQFDTSDTMPRIERTKNDKKATNDERKEFSELFEDGSSEEDDGDEDRFLMKEERPKKSEKAKPEDSDDQCSDLDEDELAQLAGSASEGESDESEGESDESEDEDIEKDIEMKNESSEDDSEVIDEGDVVEDFHLSDSD